MKRKEKVVSREERDGEITVVTEIIEETKYLRTDTYNKKTGDFFTAIYDDEGELVDAGSGGLPDSIRDLLKDRN